MFIPLVLFLFAPRFTQARAFRGSDGLQQPVADRGILPLGLEAPGADCHPEFPSGFWVGD